MSATGGPLRARLAEVAVGARRAVARRRRVLPFVSLAWGIASGVSLSRDYAHATHLFFAAAAFVLLSLWIEARALIAAARPGGDPAAPAPSPRLAAASLFLLQSLAQYVLLFTLPLLVFARSRGWAILVTAVLPTVMWDPLWERVARSRSYRAGLRLLSSLLSASFLVPMLAPSLLARYGATMAAIGALALAPWGALAARRIRPATLAPLAVFLVAAGLSSWSGRPAPWPLSGMWLRGAALGLGVKDRAVARPLARSSSGATIEAALSGGEPVCCVTPVVAPRRVNLPVTHVWSVDGREIDHVDLPPIRGADRERAFRTFSCKENLPAMARAREIACEARVGARDGRGGVTIGRVEADLVLDGATARPQRRVNDSSVR